MEATTAQETETMTTYTATMTLDEMITEMKSRYQAKLAVTPADVNAYGLCWADGDFDDFVDFDRQDETDIEAARTICLITGDDIAASEITS